MAVSTRQISLVNLSSVSDYIVLLWQHSIWFCFSTTELPLDCVFVSYTSHFNHRCWNSGEFLFSLTSGSWISTVCMTEQLSLAVTTACPKHHSRYVMPWVGNLKEKEPCVLNEITIMVIPVPIVLQGNDQHHDVTPSEMFLVQCNMTFVSVVPDSSLGYGMAYLLWNHFLT